MDLKASPCYQADVSTVIHEPWYHGDISWRVTEERLNKQDSDRFLVRKSRRVALETSPYYRADVSTVVHEPWYHGDISWRVAKERLNKQDSDRFLVRKSQSQPGKYALSVRYGGIVKNFVIRKDNQRYEVEGTEMQFSSLQELVAFYEEHYLTTDWERLTTPCPPKRLKPRPSPISVQGVNILSEIEGL